MNLQQKFAELDLSHDDIFREMAEKSESQKGFKTNITLLKVSDVLNLLSAMPIGKGLKPSVALNKNNIKKVAIEEGLVEGVDWQYAENTKTKEMRYTFVGFDKLRQIFCRIPYKPKGQKGLITTIGQLKGGEGKTTIAVNLAQWLSLQGYKVALIDFDGQASTTASLGYIPEVDIPDIEVDPADLKAVAERKKLKEESEFERKRGLTAAQCLENADPLELGAAIRSTYWPNLYLIPASLDLQEVEFLLSSAEYQKEHGDVMQELLKEGCRTLTDEYDIVLIDSPPSMGLLSINAITAAELLVIPVIPTFLDIASMVSYFKILSQLNRINSTKEAQYRKEKILTKWLNENNLSIEYESKPWEEDSFAVENNIDNDWLMSKVLEERNIDESNLDEKVLADEYEEDEQAFKEQYFYPHFEKIWLKTKGLDVDWFEEKLTKSISDNDTYLRDLLIVINKDKDDDSNKERREAKRLLNSAYGDFVLSKQILETKQLEKAGADRKNLYETLADKKTDTKERAFNSFDDVNKEILGRIIDLWDAKQAEKENDYGN